MGAVIVVFGGREGAMKVRDSDDIPRVTCHEARQEAVLVIN